MTQVWKPRFCLLSRGNCGLRKTLLSLNEMNVHLVKTRRQFPRNEQMRNLWKIMNKSQNLVIVEAKVSSRSRLRPTTSYPFGADVPLAKTRWKFPEKKCQKNHDIWLLSRRQRRWRSQARAHLSFCCIWLNELDGFKWKFASRLDGLGGTDK